MRHTFYIAGTSDFEQNFRQLGEENELYSMAKGEIAEIFFDGDRIFQYVIDGEVSLAPENDTYRVDVNDLPIGYIKRSDAAKVREIISGGDYQLELANAGYGKSKSVYTDMEAKTHVETDTEFAFGAQLRIIDKIPADAARAAAREPEKKTKSSGGIFVFLGIVLIVLGLMLTLAMPLVGLIAVIGGIWSIVHGRKKKK